MKKTLVIATVALTAAFANASSYTWGFGGSETKNADGAYFNDGTPDATAFLFLGTVTMTDTGWDFGSATLINSANMDDNYVWGYFKSDTTAGMPTVDAAAGDAVTLVLLDGEVAGTLEAFKAYEGNYIIGNKTALASESIPGTPPVPYLSAIDNTDYGASDWNKINSVPEPTSGLLLLLGVAGLALRRRRA